jgi:hypothetical protein
MLSYEQIINKFQEFAENHYYLKSFGTGEAWQIVEHNKQKNRKYPMMWVEDQPFPFATGSVTYSYRVYFIKQVPTLINDDSETLEQANVVTAKSDMLECAQDLMSFWVQDHNYPDLDVLKSTLGTPFHDILMDSLTGFYIDIKLEQGFRYDSCAIPMSGVTPLPSDCADVAVSFNGVSVTSTPSGGVKSVIVQTDEATPVQTGTIVTDTDSSLVIEVPAPGAGDPAANQVNGAAKTDIPAGGSKNFIIQDQNTNVVTVSEVSDSATEFVGSVNIPSSVTANTTHGGQNVSYLSGDDGDRFANGDFGTINLADLSDFYTLSNPNEWGHNKRITGDTGGYMDEATGNFFDVNGVSTTKALAFPNDIMRDYANRRRWFFNRSGVRTWTDAVTLTQTDSKGGETGWFLPTKEEYDSLSSNSTLSPTFIDSRLFNWSAFNMWCSTTAKNNISAAFRYSSTSDSWVTATKSQAAGCAYVKLF